MKPNSNRQMSRSWGIPAKRAIKVVGLEGYVVDHNTVLDSDNACSLGYVRPVRAPHRRGLLSGLQAMFEILLERLAQACSQQSQHRNFFGQECGQMIAKLDLDLFLGLKKQRALGVAHKDLGVDVTLAADGRRIAEPRCDLLDGVANIPFHGGLTIKLLEFLQRYGGEYSAVPCAEILRRNILATDLPEVGIDIGGGHVASFPALVEICKQLLPRQILAPVSPWRSACRAMKGSRPSRSCP